MGIDLKDLANKVDKEDIEKAVDTVKTEAKKLGIDDIGDVKEKLGEVKDMIGKKK